MIAKTLMLINVFYHVVVKTPCTDNVRHRIKYGNVLKISKGLCELRQCIHTIIKIETSVKVRLTLLTDSSILFWGESPNPCASYMLIFATYRPKEYKGTSKNTSRASRASNLSLIYSLFLVNFCL